MLPGKKPREYDLLYLDDLERGLFCPLEAFTVLAEEIRDRALAEIAGKGDLKEELFNLKMLYESGMLNEDEYKKRVDELIAELETVKEHNKSKIEKGSIKNE